MLITWPIIVVILTLNGIVLLFASIPRTQVHWGFHNSFGGLILPIPTLLLFLPLLRFYSTGSLRELRLSTVLTQTEPRVPIIFLQHCSLYVYITLRIFPSLHVDPIRIFPVIVFPKHFPFFFNLFHHVTLKIVFRARQLLPFATDVFHAPVLYSYEL